MALTAVLGTASSQPASLQPALGADVRPRLVWHGPFDPTHVVLPETGAVSRATPQLITWNDWYGLVEADPAWWGLQ